MKNSFEAGTKVVASHCIQCRGVELPQKFDPYESTKTNIALPSDETIATIITVLENGIARVSCPCLYRDADENLFCSEKKKNHGDYDARCAYVEEPYIDEDKNE